VSDGVGHCQHCQAKGEGDPEETDAERRKPSGEHRGAAAAQDQPQGAEKLRCRATRHVHGFSPLQSVTNQTRDRFTRWPPALLDGPRPFDEAERVPREPIELTRIGLTSRAL